MTKNYYEWALQIAQDLEEEGFTLEAQILQDVITSSFIATEILMGLRWHLQHLILETNSIPGSIRESMQELSKAISKALNI